MSMPVNEPPTTAADDLARREHDRRERAWIPAIQETIRWAEAQVNARRNTPAACIAQERRKR